MIVLSQLSVFGYCICRVFDAKPLRGLRLKPSKARRNFNSCGEYLGCRLDCIGMQQMQGLCLNNWWLIGAIRLP